MENDLIVCRIREIHSSTIPDILFLMKTKNKDDVVLKEFLGTDLSNHFTVPPQRLSGGLYLLWNSNVEVQVLDFSSKIFGTQIKNKYHTSYVTFIYGPPQVENRASFWEHISSIGQNRYEAWLITGDLHKILDNS